MPTELKQRKKSPKQSDGVNETSAANGEDETPKAEPGNPAGENKTSSSWDILSLMCVVSLAACAALSWLVLRQNERFSEMEEKYRSLNGRTSSLFDMEEDVLKVSEKCASVHLTLEGLGGQRGALRPRLEALEQDVSRLKDWASGLGEKRAQLQSSQTSLRDAVARIEERTSAIATDFANKVASVRTDVRRMDGLGSELESLLAQVAELEGKAARVEHGMVKRIGDVLADSVDRVSNLRAASERNTKAIEGLRAARVPELAAAHARLSDRLAELESGRARVVRTVTFASDLKPKVATIRRDFGALEPRLSDLTLRIGRLAEELMRREREVAELRETLANLAAVEGDLDATSRRVGEMTDASV
ncbi:inhibitor of nuclear factor kappa-B kinase-interacting protein isoform X2 [Pungitius pungitius]|uniref:inhibitor of nuclear factor kappa-B kinase-interacting protein isoform X2 n=1 Tax=Pungitius pungitius TaxID=134920 RepID=UPI002E122869